VDSVLCLGINLGISVYSALLLLLLFVATSRQPGSQPDHERQRTLFLLFLSLAFLVIAADFVSRLDGYPGGLYTLCRAGNFVLFLINPVMALCWYYYACEQIDLGDRARRRGLIFQVVPCALNTLTVIVTPSTGWIYYFDASCVYHRGPLFCITSVIMILMIAATEILLVTQRGTIEPSHFHALILFPVLPTLTTFLQVVSYGVAYALSGTVFSTLIVFIYVQNRNMDIDYLTGLYNRRKLDRYMRRKILSSTEEHTFSAILIDINQFKIINDSLGHNAGDAAIRDAAAILRSTLRADTFIARYGGDEFCVISDLDDSRSLERLIERIRRNAEEYNRMSGKSYLLSFSIGGDVYRASSHMSLEEYQRHIDLLMYENKRAHANISPAAAAPLHRRVSDRQTLGREP